MTEISYDVFISHAFEDKNTFTNELALALKKKGLKVWYSGSELKLGDSIADSVNKALKGAKYGVVVISPIYLEKQWAMSELKALFAQEADRNRILPILYNIGMDEIKEQLPMLADRYAISSDKGLEFIVNKVLEVISGKINVDSGSADKKRKKEKSNSDSGFITLGSAINEANVSDRDKNIKNVNSNTNSNQVTVNTGNSGGIIVIILIALVAVFFVVRSCNSSAESPKINKTYGRPSNSQ